jgi:hypothetical protein
VKVCKDLPPSSITWVSSLTTLSSRAFIRRLRDIVLLEKMERVTVKQANLKQQQQNKCARICARYQKCPSKNREKRQARRQKRFFKVCVLHVKAKRNHKVVSSTFSWKNSREKRQKVVNGQRREKWKCWFEKEKER